MKKSQHIENQVENTMASLDGIQRAAANPYLYSKIRERMLPLPESDSLWSRVQILLSRPVIAMTMICLLLLLNLFFIRSVNATHRATENTTEGEQIFATEYNLSPAGFYDQTIASNE